MSRINAIENAILELDGGKYQKLMDAYLVKKYKYENIQALGVQTGTDKVTKGTPDSYVKLDNGKYVLIMYGSVTAVPFNKLRDDILSCFNEDKLKLENEKIEKIICAYTSTNIHIEQSEALEHLVEGVSIELISLSTVANDLLVNYPFIAAEFLNIPIDTQQLFAIDDFIKRYDKNGMNAPLDIKLIGREEEKKSLKQYIAESKVTLVTGASGVGKTRLVLEVCREYQNELNYNVICVKNNGGLLYNDLHYYISDKGKYLLFIDDANQTTCMEAIMDLVLNPPVGIELKIVMTVRDYAKDRVRKLVCEVLLPKELNISILSKEEINSILKNNLEIKNEYYLEQINKIAKGNARLAILAGRNAKDRGYIAIHNALDIFKNYYGGIIEKIQLDDKQIISMFIIALFNVIDLKTNDMAIKILEKTGIRRDDFFKICHELNELEIVDLYEDEIVKISDQSLSNYILEYSLIEKRYITIVELLQVMFPKFKNKIVYAFNTIIRIFNNESMISYIKSQVNEAWDKASKDFDIEFIRCFALFNEEKALGIISSKIKDMSIVELDLRTFDFEAKRNRNGIKEELVDILVAFKESEYFSDVIELMIKMFNKRPDLVMDFYFAFSDRLSFDSYSAVSNYTKEFQMVEKLWSAAENGSNINCTLLLLHVLFEMMHDQYNRTEAGESKHSICMKTIPLSFNEGLQKLRRLIWKIISCLYENENYQELIEKKIVLYHIYNKNKEAKKIMLFDLEQFDKYFLSRWNPATFEQCDIIRKLRDKARRLGIECDERYSSYNEEYTIYYTLIKEERNQKGLKESGQDQEENVKKLISKYTEQEFQKLFQILMKLDGGKENRWKLQNAIGIIFKELRLEPNKFIDIVNIYLEEGAPYGDLYSTDIIEGLFENIGIEATWKLLNLYKHKYQSNWKCIFFSDIPETEINKKYSKELINFINTELDKDNPVIPLLYYLGKYNKVMPNIAIEIGKLILAKANDKNYLIGSFLLRGAESKKEERIYSLFSNDISILEKLYLQAMGEGFDYEGKLLIKLIESNMDFYRQVLLELFENNKYSTYEINILDLIWGMENYNEFIEIAYSIAERADDGFIIGESELIKLFISRDNESLTIRERKLEWVKDYINRFYVSDQ